MRFQSCIAMVVFSGLSFVAFGQQPPFAPLATGIPEGAVAFAFGDMDGDGDIDVIGRRTVVAVAGSPFAVFINRGTGSFDAFDIAPIAGLNPIFAQRVTALADFDGDGDLDLVYGDAGNTFFLLNNGTGVVFTQVGGSLPALGRRLSLFDFDGDGDVDIVAGDLGTGPNLPSTTLVLNNGAAGFGYSGLLPAAVTSAACIGSADFDLDGDRDLVIAKNVGSPNSFQLFVNGGGGSFAAGASFGGAAPTSSPHDRLHLVEDLDSDGRTDIVEQRWSSTVTIYRNGVGVNPPGVFTSTPSTSVLFPAVSIFAADLNADGKSELLLDAQPSFDHSRLYVWDANGMASSPVATFERQGLVHPADYDGDGDRDFFPHGSTQNPTSLWFNDGTLTLKTPFADPPPGALTHQLNALFDADLDGDLDGAKFTGSLIIARNDGHGRFTASAVATPVATSAGGSRCYPLDENADGRQDIWVRKTGSFTTHNVFRGQPGGGFVAATTTLPVVPQRVFDLDQDGDDDVVGTLIASVWPFTGSPQANSLVYVLNLGGGNWSPPAPLTALGVGPLPYLVDLDADGWTDVLVVSLLTTGYTAINAFHNSAGAALVPAWNQVTTVLATEALAATALVNGDVFPDLALGRNYFSGTGASFVPVAVPAAPTAPAGDILLRDFDDDGIPDRVTGESFQRGLGAFLFSAAEPLAGGLPLGTISTFSPYFAGDFDRDGDLDLLTSGGFLLRNRERSLFLSSVAVAGAVADLEATGPAFAPVDFIVSPSILSAPLNAGPWGFVLVDPVGAQLITGLSFDATGHVVLPLAVPNVPGLAGLTLWWQTAIPSVQRLSNATETKVLAL